MYMHTVHTLKSNRKKSFFKNTNFHKMRIADLRNKHIWGKFSQLKKSHFLKKMRAIFLKYAFLFSNRQVWEKNGFRGGSISEKIAEFSLFFSILFPILGKIGQFEKKEENALFLQFFAKFQRKLIFTIFSHYFFPHWEK